MRIRDVNRRNPHATAVLAYFQWNDGLEESWSHSERRYLAEFDLAPWDNGREKGYVLSLGAGHKRRNIAFFENRTSDDIIAWAWTDDRAGCHLPTWREVAAEGPDITYETDVHGAYKMAELIMQDFTDFWLANTIN